ncbi:MAG: alpha/beta fold hydrolase [Gammaproteobacteria bacterium]
MAGFFRYLSGLISVRGPLREEKRLRSSGIAISPEIAATFEQYQQQSRQRLAQYTVENAPVDADEIVKQKAAYCLRPDQSEKGKRRSVLIVHGLTDTAFSTRDLGAFLQSRGFHVLSIVLPGHGTCPGDLPGVTSNDWLRTVAEAIDLVKKESDEVYLAGFSIGATLILHHVLAGVKVNGLLLFSPAIRLHRVANLSCFLVFLSRWLPHFKWLDVLPDTDPYKYETLAMNAICESALLMKEVRKRLKTQTLAIPTFISASQDDATVIGREALVLFKSLTSKRKRMIYYARQSVGLPPGVRWIKSSLPQQGIISAAHTSAYIHPKNPHYGRQGRYASCVHLYRNNPEGYLRCKSLQEDALGEIGVEKNSARVLRRLTFNPWFETLEDELDKYFMNIE